MAIQLPEYIGLPGEQVALFENIDSEQYKKDMLLRYQIARIIPRDVGPSLTANFYKGKECLDDFKSYLKANGITMPDGMTELKIVVNNITPMSETYTNEYGQSSLLSGVGNIMGETGSELAFAFGMKDFDDTIKNKYAKSDNPILKGIGTAATTVDNKLKDLATAAGGEKGTQLYNTLKSSLTNPNCKIDFPQFWKSSGYSCSYELSVRLYCYNTQSDKDYGKYILAPYGALMQFVLPRSYDGNLYTWPFLMDFRIPGLVHLPLCYCSNIAVIKGGDQNDISLAYRPNMIDLRMTINPVYNVMYNINKNKEAFTEDGLRPSLINELTVLSEKRKSFTEQELLDAKKASEIDEDIKTKSKASINQSNNNTKDRSIDENTKIAADALNNVPAPEV